MIIINKFWFWLGNIMVGLFKCFEMEELLSILLLFEKVISSFVLLVLWKNYRYLYIKIIKY